MPLIPFYAARRSLLRFADGLRAVDFFKAVAVIFGVGLLSAAWAESPDIAGRVQFVVGEVSAADRDGAARALGKRDAIFEGDTVTTGPSASAQIMMIDGARIAVRPNSAFMVNEYRAPSADDIGASILTLLKGGFRTLSGLIGEESAQYRIDTPCCAIGLRGTDHAVFHIPEGEEDTYGGGEAGTYNKVYKGATFLESAGVTLDITPQTAAGFAARGQPPVFVPDIPETAEGAVVLAPSEDEDEKSDESEAAENESEEGESEDESESETETADADDSNSESDDAVLAESPADESSGDLETAETVEIASESAAPPVADLQNPVDIADALQRENTMPQSEPPSPVISLTSDLTMLQEGRQVILRVSSDIVAPSGGLMVTINIGNAMAGEFNFAGGVCTALECVVTIPANSRTAELILTPISDSVIEDLENWTATLGDGGLNYNIDNTMMDVGFDISDQPVIGIATADMAMVREGGEIRLTVSSDIAAPSGGLMVTINIGNAMAGEFGISGGDCTALECVVVIPAGMLAATLTITPISDSVNEDLENWMATLGDGGLNYNIDNTMMDVGFDISDQPVIGIATADMAIVREGGEIRLTVSSDIAAPSGGLMVTINIGNAMAGEFGIAGGVCTALECVVTIPESSRTAELILTPISDSVIEDLENWMATLGDGGLNYNIDNTMMNVGFDIFDDPILLAAVDVEGGFSRENSHVQEYEVVLAWHAVPGFDSASSYRVYRDGVRADGQFIGDRGTESLTIDNALGPLSFSIDFCDADGCLLDSGDDCLPADACRAVVANVPGTSFIFTDFGLFDAESGRIIGLFDGGVSHTYEIRAVDENGVETLVVGPIALTAPAVVNNNLEDFVPAEFEFVLAVNEYLPVLDAVMPSDFVFGNGGILASQTDADVISDDGVFSTVDGFSDFRASTYEGTTPDLGSLLGLNNPSRVHVYRSGGFNSPLTAGIEEFTFSYAIEAGAVTRLTDYDVLIRPSGERWEFGLAEGSRVDLTHAETFFDVAGTAFLPVSGEMPVDGIASFGSNNERVFSRFSVDAGIFDRQIRRLSGRFDIIPQPDFVDPILAVVDGGEGGFFLEDAPHVQEHDVLLAWHAVPGFNDATDYRVYRDGVRADGEFTDGSLSVNNGLGPLTVSIGVCNVFGCFLDVSDVSDGSVNRVFCVPDDACRAAAENVPGTSFIFADFGLVDAESGRIISLFDGGVSHTYEIRAVDENGVETPVVGPIALTAPAVVNNNLEDFVPANSVAVDEVNDYLPVLDAVMPSDFIIGNGGILASQTNVSVFFSDDRVLLYSNSDEDYFGGGTYEGTPDDLSHLLGLDNPSRVYVYRAGGLNPALSDPSSAPNIGIGIDEFTFSYAIEAGDVTRLTDYDVVIEPTRERWEFGLAEGSRVDLTHAETFFEVAGTADLDTTVSGGAGAIDGIASFGSNNERVFSRFSVEGGGAVLRGRFDIPAGGNSQ